MAARNALVLVAGTLAELPAGDTLIGAGGGSDPWSFVKLASDVANSAVTLADVTGMQFTAVANTTYLVDLTGTFQAAAATTGVAVALFIPSGQVAGQALHPVSTTASNSIEQIASGATTGVTTGVRAAATNTPVWGRWIVTVGATGGTVKLQFRSEVAASAVTMKAALTALGWRSI